MVTDARIHTRPTLTPTAGVLIADDPVELADRVEIDWAHEERCFRTRPTIDA